jgi:DNA mismatch repair protein MutL
LRQNLLEWVLLELAVEPGRMSKIKSLSESVIAAIAAGEVAERPAVIVKELLENAIDAEATQIAISLDNAGLNRIVVTDNGIGMDKQDLEAAVQRHTTSKIFSIDDLEQVKTLGFRGEALASIGSVSRLTIQSKPAASELGYQLTVDNSQAMTIEPLGIPNGTTVMVEHLFESIPARRKFLKQPATELKYILEIATATALSHPMIGFQLFNNQKLLFQVPSHQILIERIRDLFGQDIANRMIPLNFEHTYFTVKGFVGQPQLARRSQHHQFVFVNQRFVTHPAIARTIKNTFGSLIEPKAEPFFMVLLALPQPVVDVNVHPRKETVTFMDEPQILELINRAVNEALTNHNLSYTFAPEQPSLLRDKTASPATSRGLKKAVKAWQLTQESSNEILQIHHTYLLTQTDQGMVMVDQHAAHERILYEQFLAGFEHQQHTTQSAPLPQPVTLELSLVDAQVLIENLEMIRDIGFEIDEFGRNSFKVTALPQLLADRDVRQLLTELIDDLNQGKPITGLDSLAERTLAYLACRQAIKAGDYLTPNQRRELVKKLAETKSNFTCPHGRPVSITVHLKDFEKIFKRSGF